MNKKKKLKLSMVLTVDRVWYGVSGKFPVPRVGHVVP